MSESLALMPWPRRVTRTDAPLELTAPSWSVSWVDVRTLRLERSIARMIERITRLCGAGATLSIDCAAASAPYPDLDDDESYLLKIDSVEAHITAATEWGVLRAVATLAQLTAIGKTLPGGGVLCGNGGRRGSAEGGVSALRCGAGRHGLSFVNHFSRPLFSSAMGAYSRR